MSFEDVHFFSRLYKVTISDLGHFKDYYKKVKNNKLFYFQAVICVVFYCVALYLAKNVQWGH